jgi:hypothetical protein
MKLTELRLLCWNRALKRRAFRGIISVSGERFSGRNLENRKEIRQRNSVQMR